MHDQSLSQEQVAAVHIERGVPFGAVDGRVLLMDIAQPDPQPTAPLPAVIDIHGGGWAEGERGVSTDSILPNNGFFYCSIDYRLSGEAPFPAQIHDCKAAVRWLRANAARLRIDPDRIGVWGMSAGGHLAQLLGTSAAVAELEGRSGTLGVPSHVQAVAGFVAPTWFGDPLWHKHFEPGNTAYRLFGGDHNEKADLARLADPLTHVRPGAPPFLIVHGDRDPISSAWHAVRLHDALRAAGADSTLWVYGGYGHDLGERWNECRQLLLRFFQHHLDAPRCASPQHPFRPY